MPNENNTPTVWARFIAAQADMENPVKTKAVRAGAKSYSYEVLPDVLEIVKTALHAHGLALIQAVGASDVGWTLRTGVADDQGPLWLDERPLEFPADDHVAASKQTYAKRYAIKTVFGLAGLDEDDDGQAAHKAATMPTRSPQTASKAPSSPKPTNEPSARGFKEMKALLDKCRQAGMDMQSIGVIITDATGKKSTEFGPADYAMACGILEEMLKEATK